MFSGQTTHAKHSHTSKRQIQPYNQQITHKQCQERLETRTLTSRTWKWVRTDRDTGLRSTAARVTDLRTGGTAVDTIIFGLKR